VEKYGNLLVAEGEFVSPITKTKLLISVVNDHRKEIEGYSHAKI
jgi:hypothetical protein